MLYALYLYLASALLSHTHTHTHTQISGTDFLDRNRAYNKLFPDHNHVIIPYCSSDLWLGEELSGEECSCFNDSCFNFDPSSEGLQFTFRGKRIFQSIFSQLMRDYGLMSASEVVLAGSSAGGVGVVNHAQWAREQLSSNIDLLVIFESAWFINFQGKRMENVTKGSPLHILCMLLTTCSLYIHVGTCDVLLVHLRTCIPGHSLVYNGINKLLLINSTMYLLLKYVIVQVHHFLS